MKCLSYKVRCRTTRLNYVIYTQYRSRYQSLSCELTDSHNHVQLDELTRQRYFISSGTVGQSKLAFCSVAITLLAPWTISPD